MSIQFNTVTNEVIDLIKQGKIGIIRTDTIYGVVGQAAKEAAVERIFALKGRDETKPPIVLIHDMSAMYDQPSSDMHQFVSSVWPGRVSVIVPSPHAPAWISRGETTATYRVPADESLRKLLSRTGPLIAPSANPQSLSPATTIQEAVHYFGEQVDFYVDGGRVTDNTPSQLLRITDDGQVERLR
jgi:tRNA threonylcarbamoyl adenosine modification protein (Sua5/YciO/YrdC/YwlC family)